MKHRISKDRTKLNLLVTGAIILLGGSNVAHAQDQSLDDLLAMDIESLSNIEVSVASKKSEKVASAPGIITVITRKEIEQFGGVNLLDIFHRIPSMQVIGGTFVQGNTVSMRAQSNQHYTNRILFLIDGRPYRDTTAGGWNMVLFTQFPLNNIEQIEIIRGPGSVLYGTNAFSGVVNIITRKADNNELAEASITYGSDNMKQVEGRAAYAGDNWSIVGAVNKVERDGDAIIFKDANSKSGSMNFDNGDGHGLSVLANLGSFTMQSFTGQVAQDSLGTQQFFPVEKNDVMRHFVNVGYTHDFNKNWNADFNLTFNRIEYNESSDEDTLIGEITVHGSLAENLNMTLGGTSEHTDGTAIDNFQDHVHSLYAQLEWQSTDWLKMVGGLQMNDSENYKVGYSPRLAAIFTPHENWSAKLLYGEAFRAASAIETFVTIPGVLSSTSNVSPEKISTLEGQILYHDMNSSASVSIYRSRITDIIGRENTGLPGNLLITNTGEEVYKGIEFEGKYEIFTGLSIQGSANLQYGKNDEDIYNPTYYPNWMVKAGFVYEADGWSFAAFNSSYGDPEDIRGTNPNVLDVNDASKGYSLISANLNVDVNELAGFHNAPKITFTLHGENLLDEEMNFPDFNRRDVNSYPIDSGRSVYGKISVRF